MKHLSKVSLFQKLFGIALHTMQVNSSPRLITYSYRMLVGLLLFLVSNQLSAQSGTFSWSTSGVGNAWAVSDNTKSYPITYTEGGVTKTVTVTMTIIDPSNRNYDLDVYTTHPFDTGGGCLPYPGSTETDNITGNGTITDPWDSDCGSIFTETEGAYGTGYLTFAIKTLNSSEDVTIRYTFSKPIFLNNYTVGDIDYVGLAYSNSINIYEAPGNSYQDEVSFSASGIGGNVPIDIVAGTNLTKTGQTVKATYNTNATGDVDPNLAANTATLSTTKAITSFDVAYSNGPEDASAEQNNPSLYSWWSVTAGKGATNGVSDDHAIRISGFTFTVCPTFIYPSINTTICAGKTATVTATPSNGTAPYTYSWSTGSTAASITVNPTTTTQYVVTVTDANGCAETTTAQVTVNPLPNANAGTDKTLTCTTTSVTLNGSSTTSGVSYSWTTTGGNIVSGATTATPVVNAAGTYVLTVRNTTTNCTATSSVTVTLNNTAPNVNAGTSKVLTCTATSVTLDGSSTTSGVTYAWSTTGGNIVSGGTTATPVVNAAGTYVLTVTNPTTGCTATSSVAVTLNNTAPNVNAGTSKVLTCIATSITLNGSSTTSGVTYAWSTIGGNIVSGGTTATPVVNAAGTYVLTVTNPTTGCTSTSSVAVTLSNTAPNASAGASKVLTCTTTSVTLDGSSTTSGVTYAWSTTGGNIVSGVTTATPVVNAAGTYILTVTNPTTGCTATSSVVVTLSNTAPNASAGASKVLTCTTTSVTLDGSSTTSGVTYAWSTTGGNIVSGGTTATPVVNAAGTYILTVTNPTTGCTSTSSVAVILDNTAPNVNAGLDKTLTCTTTSVTLNGSSMTSGVTYAWSTTGGNIVSGGTTATPVVNAAGTYILTVTNPTTGCTSTSSVAVTLDNTAPNVNAGLDKTLTCTVTSITLNGSSTTSGITYAWSTTGGNIVSGGTTASPVVNASGTYVLTVTNPATGCTATDAVIVTTDSNLPNVNAGADKTLTCIVTSVTLNGSSTTSGVTYAWTTTGGNIVSGATTATPVVNAGGTYVLTITNPATGCTATDNVVVTLNNIPPAADAGLDKTINCTTTSVTIGSDGIYPNATYSWSPSTGLSSSSSALPTATPTSTTTYVLTITDNVTGCTATDAVVVTVDKTPPTATITGAENLTCSVTTVTRTASGGGTYLWSNGLGTTASVSITSAGTYTITVMSANGCTATATTIVTLDNTAPNVNAGLDKTLTCTTTSVTLNGSSTTSGVTYAWSTTGGNIVSGGTTASPVVNSSGTYVLTVTNPATGCTATDAVIVTTDSNLPNVNAGADKTLTCIVTSVTLNGSSTTSGVTYAWTTTGGNIVSGATTATPVVNAGGTYVLTITNPATGCTATDNVVVTLNNTPPIADAGLDKTVNCTITSVTIGSDGIYPNATYSWSPITGLSSSSSALPTATPTSTTTYVLTITDNVTGCTATDAVVVTVDKTPPTATITGAENLTCSVTTVTRTASGGGTYLWSNGLGTTASVSITSAGTYTVTVMSANGCTATATTVVTTDSTVPQPTTVSAERCGEGTLTLSATGCTGTYNWYSSNTSNVSLATTSAFTTPVLSATTDYYVSCTIGLCTSSRSSVTATVNPNPSDVVAGSNSAVKEGSPINLTATSTNGTSYSWAGPNGFISTVQNPVISGSTELMEGVYTVTVTSPKGCTATATTSVIVFNLINLPQCTDVGQATVTASTNSPILSGGTINLTSISTGALDYAWNGPNGFTSSLPNPSITNSNPTMAGVYTVAVTVDGICKITATTNVVINCLVNPIVGSNTPICVGNSINLSASGANSYSWTGPNNFTSTQQNPTIINAQIAAQGVYTVTLTGVNCTTTVTTNVVVNPLPIADAGLDKTINCTTSSVQIGSDAVIPNAMYLWSPSAGLNATNGSVATATPTTTTTYILTVTNNQTGCTATDAVVVTVDKSVPVADAGIDKTINCTTISVELGSDAVIPNATYLWSPSAGLNVTNGSVATATPTTTTTYILTVTNNQTGCTATDAVVVTVDKSVPVADAGIDKTINCTTTSVEIGSDAVIPNATYLWSPSAGLNATNGSVATATPTTTTTYILTVTNNLTGCTATDAVVVTVDKTAPTASIAGSDNLTCTASSVTRVASGGGTYLWSNNLGTSATATISAAGTYTVTVTAPNGCTATATTSVTVDTGVPTVTISATEDTLTCLKTQSVLTAEITPTGTYTYLWSNGNTASSINVNDAGTYSVEVIAANGCKASASILIREFNTVTAQVDVNDVDCKGGNNGKITVTGFDGIAPYKFKLNTGVFQSNNVFSGLTTGTYAVAIQDAGGCTASINVSVKEPLTNVALTVTPTNLKCNGATDGQIQATATGGTPAYTFAINSGTAQSNSLFTNLGAGTYTITATDTKGCSTTVTTEITQPTKLTITAVGSMIDCSTPKGTITATVTGGTPAYQYSIDGTNFQPSNSFANLNGGTYTITVKDLNLCMGTVTAAITVADTLKPKFTSVTATMATCTAGTANNDGKLTITGVVNGVSYQYSVGSSFNASAAFPTVAAAIPTNGVLANTLTNPTANSQMYTIRIFNNNGCYKDVTVELLKRVCDCKTDICVPILINKTKTRSK